MSRPDDDDTFATLVQRGDELTLRNRAMDEAPIGITIADLHTEDDELVYINAGFERLTGYSRHESLGKNCRFLQGPETAAEPVTTMRSAIEAHESVQVELLNYRKDGTEFWNEVTLSPIPESDGTVRYYVGFQQEITKRKEYEQRIEEQRDDLELLNELVRHDLRNDLQLILAFADMLRDHVDEPGIEHLDAVLESARHAVDLTESARDMAAFVVQEDSEEHAVSLPDCLYEQLASVRSSYPDARIELDSTIPPVSVTGNDLLGSVFGNLLRNAVLHNTGDSHIVVSVSVADDTATIRVSDNGPGIEDAFKDEIFGRGEKGPESEGSGIGLYLVDTLVTGYGGNVRVEDNDPEGAVFIVELPVVDAQANNES